MKIKVYYQLIFLCYSITEEQRETLTEIFNEFNKDGDDEWSFTEFETYFMDSGDPEIIFDEFDTDDDGEIDFVEMMAGLKVQSTITPKLLEDTYGDDINYIYNMTFNLNMLRYGLHMLQIYYFIMNLVMLIMDIQMVYQKKIG